MLHAFNQKNVRRILHRDDDEHTIEKTEDAVTSMVFSPLAFMSAGDAFACLQALVGPKHLDATRSPVSHRFELWPAGLTARAWGTQGHSRCEPDLLIDFEFGDGASLSVIGEMKWDWRMPAEKLGRELGREREAVRTLRQGSPQFQFVIAKFAEATEVDGVPVISWTQVSRRLTSFARLACDGAPQLWARQVRTFLAKADLEAFSGIPSTVTDPGWDKQHAFWRGGSAPSGFMGFGVFAQANCRDWYEPAFWRTG